MKTLLLAGLALAIPTLAAADTPPVKGTYELAKVLMPKQKEVDVEDALKGLPDAVWGRFLLTFEGDRLTVRTQLLQKDKSGYHACNISASGAVAWAKSSFTVAVKIEAESVDLTFSKLTSTSLDSDDRKCSTSFDAGTFAMDGSGDTIKMKGADGSISTLKRVNVEPEWSKRVK